MAEQPVLDADRPRAPLDGVVVVALEQAIAAPLATRHLADLGATVLKIERPDGGDFARDYDTNLAGQSTFFVWANRGKQSVALDLKDDGDRATLDALVAGADVFIQNLSPAAAGRLGVLADQLHERYPKLVACDISGYGLDGPRTDDKAYDLAIQAEAGAMALTGTPDDMAKVGFSVADISAAMYSLSSILAALYRRAETGAGAAISVSMLECLTEWTAVHVYNAAHAGATPSRSAHRHTTIAPYGLFALADGSKVMVVVQSNREWVDFATVVLERPELGTDERFAGNADRIANVDALESIVADVFGALDADVVLDRLVRGRIAWARARTPLEVWEHEQHAARGRAMDVTVPGGATTVFRPPFNISETPAPPSNVPALDDHDPALVQHVVDRGERGPA